MLIYRAYQMAKISRLIRILKLNNYHSHFAVELLLVIIVVIAASGNLMLKANLSRAAVSDKSLLFAYLQENSDLNEKLYNSFETVNVRVADNSPLEKQVLAASVKAETSAPEQLALLPTLSGQTLLKPNSASNGNLLKKDIEVYEVKGGDTIAQIAAEYNVSQRTITDENGLSDSGVIRPGQTLRILPTTGVKHIIKDGETLDSVAKKYNVDLETVLEYNEIEIIDHIFPGEEIIIPNAVNPTPATPPTPQRQQYLADLKKEDYAKAEVPADYAGGSADFIWPMPAAKRLSQSFWSKHRAIDVPCRDCQVVASADGIVEIAGWQTGYGNTILINHGNGMRTRYGHASKLLVSAGEAVQQGQAIMVSGSTGRSTGPHLHFEIRKSSTYLDPMKYLVR